MKSSVKLDTKELDKLIAKVKREDPKIVRKVALRVLAGAKIRAPVETGALKNSLDAKEESEDLYIVHDAVEYGIYQELGTSKMAAQPFMVPAVEAERDSLEKEYRNLLK